MENSLEVFLGGSDENGSGGPFLWHEIEICSVISLSLLPPREKTELYLDPSGHQSAPEPGEPMLQGPGPSPCQPGSPQLGRGAGAHQPRVCR